MFGIKMKIRKIRWYIGKAVYFRCKPQIWKSNENEKATIIILSYKRPQNIAPIVKHALCCDFVEKVIVSNNNPDVRIDDYVRIASEKLLLFNQSKRTPCRYRWNIAKKYVSKFYILIDDDVFIFPSQLSALFSFLIQNSENVHGLFGSGYIEKDKKEIEYIRSENVLSKSMQVDVVHQIYAVARTHVEKYFYFREMIKKANPVVFSDLDEFGDDILISYTSQEKPLVHNVGFVYECPSSVKAGVAQNAKPEFSIKRKKIKKLVKLIHA